MMSDLTTCNCPQCDVHLEDTTLQAIAEAWAGSWQREIRELSPELADLLDALGGTDDE